MFTKVGAVLLAAGASRRMGETKQLLPVGDEPAVVHCVRRLRESGVDDIVVVVGHDRWRVAAALEGYAVCIAVNADAHSEMAESVRVGTTTMPQYVTGVMVALCDHPLVAADTYALLKRRHHVNPGHILLPVYRGRGGHPTLFPRTLCRHVSEKMPLNRIVRRYVSRVSRIPIHDPGLFHDMDTEQDYRRVLSLAENQTTA
ncbi:MAG: nucleotidyltransferase family protein [Thermodesulfobacteriota bacterium]